jgi:hypothetical protein
VYQIIKDFAGPGATVIASGVAAWITWYFASWQAATASRAVDIAHDRLRFDLFGKRYEIYEAARKAIEITFERQDEDKMPDELNAIFLNFKESRFFFPEDIYLFLDRLRKDITVYLQRCYLHRKYLIQNTGTQSVEIRRVILEEEANLLKLKEDLHVTELNLTNKFGHALSFRQLTVNSII